MEVSPPCFSSSAPQWLQWGHDKIVMEVKVYEGVQEEAITLQWGHDKIVMEVYDPLIT